MWNVLNWNWLIDFLGYSQRSFKSKYGFLALKPQEKMWKFFFFFLIYHNTVKARRPSDLIWTNVDIYEGEECGVNNSQGQKTTMRASGSSFIPISIRSSSFLSRPPNGDENPGVPCSVRHSPVEDHFLPVNHVMQWTLSGFSYCHPMSSNVWQRFSSHPQFFWEVKV